MGSLIVGFGFFGVVLGRLYKWIILIPVLGVAIILLLLNAHAEGGFLGVLARIIAVAVSLQIGYGVGLIARSFSFGAKRLRDRAVEGAEKSVANDITSRESGRRAA